MIRLVICSPQPSLRAGLRALLTSDPDILVVDTAGRLAGPLPEGVTVVVVTAGGLDLAVPALHPGLGLLLVAGGEAEAASPAAREARQLAALDLRAWGILSPEATAEALQAAVRALAEGLVVGSPEHLQLLLAAPAEAEEAPGETEPAGPHERLTERESEVLRLVAQGLTNKQIALALAISEHTVKFHVSAIYAKLGATNRTEAVRKGARRGWVPL